MSSGSGKVVCVTGGAGYIASWIVKFLLQRGYTVRASVRDPADPKKTDHLRSLDGASERLHLFKANLLEEGSFDAGIEGCDGVFHTASPFYHAVTDPQAELIEPAVKGTLNVLASCKKYSIKRIVLTSSMAAVVYNEKERTPDVVVDETWWSSPEVCERDKQWYVLSKALAENAAWKFAKENGLDIITINPAMVIGPLLQPTLNTSASVILNLINGATTYPNFSFGWVNVKDVAMAHILAFEQPSASGRYCLVERVVHYSEVVKIIHELYPDIVLPEKCADDKPFAPTYQVSKEKFRSLGLDYVPLETSLKETIESLKANKFSSRLSPTRDQATLTNGSEGKGKGKVVCVTGASGYIASWVVKLLLQRGYAVRASVRDPADHKKTQHLLALDGATERLHLFRADLLEEGSFDDGIQGCDGVFHIASPCYTEATDPQAELVEPAVKGALNVLTSCKKFAIKRVVLTSSAAAVQNNDRIRNPDVVVDETWWSTPQLSKQEKRWYSLSKTMAEEAAWKFAKENSLDMVTINPSMVIGPLLQPTVNLSSSQILNLINGSSTFPNMSWGWVNVKDVAMAHVMAFELPSASGRYCVAERVAHFSEIVEIIHELYPHLKLPEKCADEKPFKPTWQFSKEKYKSLGLSYSPLKASIKETIESLKEKNFVSL